jgi:amidophosphoribosyltransferase
MAGGLGMHGGIAIPDRKLNEECGIFGIYGNNDESLSRITFYGLYALQHRGQQSAGIAVSKDGRIHHYKQMGLVSEVFDDEIIDSLQGRIACGHVRYSTADENHFVNSQPLVVTYRNGSLAIAHNGNLVNVGNIRNDLERQGVIFQTSIDSEVIANLIARLDNGDIIKAIKDTMMLVKGAYALVIMTADKLIGVRDPNGIRPLSIGIKDDSLVLASESCAFDTIRGRLLRDVEPGEIVVIDNGGLHSHNTGMPVSSRLCIFEYIYLARPDSVMAGRNVYMARKEAGATLYREHPADADIVISVPDSGTAAAIGYSEASGIPFVEGLVKNRYVGRTFIQPKQRLREIGVSLKLNVLEDIVKGKRVVMVDDSIVRGTTSRKLVQMIKNAGATEVHFRVSSPPVKHPCFFGIDTPDRKELIGANYTTEQIKDMLQADSLGFLSIDGMRRAIGQCTGYCDACFTGDYPIDVPERAGSI